MAATPSVTDWLTAAGTGLAAVGTIIAAGFGVSAYRQGKADHRERDQQERMDQAKKCWDIEVRRDTYWRHDTEPQLSVRLFVELHNDSDEPIYEVAAWGACIRWSVPLDGPALPYSADSKAVGPKAIGPGKFEPRSIIFDIDLEDRLTLTDAEGWLTDIWMEFTDSAGRRWQRHGKEIKELGPNDRMTSSDE